VKRLLLREEARAELLHEVGYYEARQPGLGRRFREAVAASFQLIRRFPEGGAPAPHDTRKTKVRGFPFTVVHRDEPGAVVVFAIAPDRQQAGYWWSRLR
jgi:plasmid stabilization system protein ParE